MTKFTAHLLTTNDTTFGLKFTPEALESVVNQAKVIAIPLTYLNQTVGAIENLRIENGSLICDTELDISLESAKSWYVVPSGTCKTEDTSLLASGERIVNRISVNSVMLTLNPADSSLTPLTPTEGETK